jgi:Sulfotransferase family
MALLLPHSIFFHIPKTGGTWVRAAVKNAGIPSNEVFAALGSQVAEPDKLFHARPDQLEHQGHFRFAFVRHPLTAYQSYWCYKMRLGVAGQNAFDARHMQPDFHGFVRSVLAAEPWLTVAYISYYGFSGEGLHFVGKQEHLADDLVRALRLAGEDFDEDALRKTPPVNESGASPELRARAAYTPELAREVCERERWVLDTFGYPDDPLKV